MIEILRKSILFKDFDEKEIDEFIKDSGSFVSTYKKGEIIFDINEKPSYVYVLLDGAVSINRDTFSGKKILVTKIEDKGDIFAEVYLFLKKESYDFYTMVENNKTSILKIPKETFLNTKNNFHEKLVKNMLTILSQKAYNLTQKLQILSIGGLRQKISKILLEEMDKDKNVNLTFNREELADYLNVARPSLSRELANMQSDGLIEIAGKSIKVVNYEALENEI